jgi:hypothetical protein
MNEQPIIIDAIPFEHAEAITAPHRTSQDRLQEMEALVMAYWDVALDMVNVLNLYIISGIATAVIIVGMVLVSSVIVAPFFRSITLLDMTTYYMGLPVVFIGILMLVSAWGD